LATCEDGARSRLPGWANVNLNLNVLTNEPVDISGEDQGS